jgi:hypothetical protein
MTSKVESLSARTAYRPAPVGGRTSSDFPETYRIAAASELLKSTGQYEKFAALSQKNDTDAAGDVDTAQTLAIADLVLERHDLLEKVRRGQDIDWTHFDTLTQTLSEKGIRLFSSSRLAPPATVTPSLPEPSGPLLRLAEALPAPSTDDPPRQAEETAPPAPKVPPKVSAGVEAADPPPKAVTREDEILVDVRYKNTVLSPALMGLGNSKQLFLPLSDISRILEFNLSSDLETRRAQGWFLSPDRTFDLNLDTGKGTSDGNAFALSPNQMIQGEDDVYVDTATLSRLFPVDFTYDFSDQSLRVNPREELPFQARMARERNWKLRQVYRLQEPELPLKTPRYQFMDPLFIDMGFSAAYTDAQTTARDTTGNFYLIGHGDMGFMNSEFYITGNEDEAFNTTRLTLSREDPDANMLGPLNATRTELGDVRVPTYPIVGGGKFERGASIGNLPLKLGTEFDTTYFSGNTGPGWDVELYRNGVLLNSQRVGADGRYIFEEVPLYQGTNEFTLKLYGPQGQEKEETKRVVVGPGMIKKGAEEYQFSVTQKDTKILDPRRNIPNTADKESTRMLWRYRYGMDKNLSLQTGLLSQDIQNTRHNYVNVGGLGYAGETFLSGDLIMDTAGGNAVEGLVQRKFGPFDIKLKQQVFDNFVQEGDTDQSNSIRSKTEISGFGLIPTGKSMPDMPFSLNFRNTKRKNSEARVFGGRISAQLGRTYLNNYLQWEENTDFSENSSVIDGSTQLASQFGKFRIRGNLNYDLYPEADITKTWVSGLYNLTSGLSTELTLGHDFENDNLSYGTFGLNWNNGKFLLSPQFSYNSDDKYTAALSFSTSFGSDPRTGKTKFSATPMADQGGVSARVFLDKNNNKIFDDGDEPIKNAQVEADQAGVTEATDENGVAFLTGLRKNNPTDITLKTETLEDPFWAPSLKGNSVLPRPGHVDLIDIPVTPTGEIDGVLYTENATGEKKSLNHAPLRLMDQEGRVVQEVRSEYDGFYLFMAVPPGEYRVGLDPEFEKTLGTEKFAPLPVTIGSDGNVISGMDLVLKPAKTPLYDIPDQVAAGRDTARPDRGPLVRWLPDEASQPEPSRSEAHPTQPAGTETIQPEPIGPEPTGTHQEPASAVPQSQPIPVQGSALREPLPRAASPGSKPAPGVQEPDRTPVLAFDPPSPAPKPAVQPLVRAVSKPAAAQTESALPARRHYGLHLASYRTMEKALAGIQEERRKYKGRLDQEDFTIQKVDLGTEKGIWYRILAGTDPDPGKLNSLGTSLKRKAQYARVVSMDGVSGVHLASYRSRDAAQKGIAQLKASYPDLLGDEKFSIRTVDLGSKRGIWHRVVAGNFASGDQASEFKSRIQGQAASRAYAAPMGLEPRGQYSVHAASFRSQDKAVKGAALLIRDIGPLADISIKKMDLGKKGIWYRVMLGRFSRKQDALPLETRLRENGQYAKLMTLESSVQLEGR